MSTLALVATIGRSCLALGQRVGVVFLALTAGAVDVLAVERPRVEWLRESARPFDTCEPVGADRDLAPLRAMVGDARIIALGEVSSGTHEFFQMKRRIIQHLATHMGVAFVGFEEQMSEVNRLNEYVLTGQGDPKALLKRIRRPKDMPSEVDGAILNARTIVQIADVNAGKGAAREDIMAENVVRMPDQAPPGSKMVLWADNLRLARHASIGASLASRYGREFVVSGFAFHEGVYNPVNQREPPGEKVAQPSSPGILEWECHSSGLPRFVLDLRTAAADPGASAWLAQPLPMRTYASQAIPEPIPVGRYYDALVYFDRTTPSKSLP